MIFNCEKLARSEIEKIRGRVKDKLSLGVIQIGEDRVSEVYINEKKKAAKRAGMGFNHYKFPKTVTLNGLEEEIRSFSDDGIIVQLPIKGELETQKVLNLVSFEKDVDGLSETSIGRLVTGRLNILPPVIGAVDKILTQSEVDLEGKVMAVVGPGRLVGKPAIIYGLSRGATIISVDEKTKSPKKLTRKADVLVTGVGKPNLITGNMIKEGAIVIDAGTSKREGSVVGDVDIESVKDKAELVTPVPGGVGPLTVAVLLDNLTKKYGN